MDLFDPLLITGQLPAPYRIRPLHSNDFSKGFGKLLSQLSDIENLNEAKFSASFNEMLHHGSYFIVVIENCDTRTLVATGSLLLERKFLHGGGLCGHIEDVVVDKEVRSKRFGCLVVDELKHLAIHKGCYKLCLDCATNNIGFYERLGFKQKEIQMVLYFQSKL